MEKNTKGSSVLLTKVVPVVSLAAVVGMGALTYSTVVKNQNLQQQQQQTTVVAEAYTSGSNIVVTDDNRDVVGEVKDKAEKGMIAVRMTQNWVFTDKGMSSNAYLANSQRNETPLRFTITMADTGEVLMQSPDVPVGSCIERFPLNKELEPGKYNVIIAHQQVENGEIINTVMTATEITVKE